MAKFGECKFGTFKFGLGTACSSAFLYTLDDPRLVTSATGSRALEGPQIVIEWESPEEPPLGGLVRVVRKLYEFAVKADDPAAIVVYEGAVGSGYVADLDVGACTCYYYTIFTFDPLTGLWVFSEGTQVAVMAIETGYFTNRLMELLPELYLISDKMLEEGNKDGVLPLFPVFDEESRQWFNIHENPEDPEQVAGVLMGEVKPRGPLSRYLKTLAIDLDIAKGLIDCMPTLWDVDEACCDALPALGALVGLDVNREFPCTKQREEIRQQAAILKIKGTLQAIEARARLISGLRVRVHEWCKNILIANRLDRTSVYIPNLSMPLKYRRCGDDTDFTPGQEITFQSFTVCFELDCDDCLSEQVVEKLQRVMPPEWPVCRSGYFFFEGCVFEETVPAPWDSWWDVIETGGNRINQARINTGRIG